MPPQELIPAQAVVAQPGAAGPRTRWPHQSGDGYQSILRGLCRVLGHADYFLRGKKGGPRVKETWGHMPSSPRSDCMPRASCLPSLSGRGSYTVSQDNTRQMSHAVTMKRDWEKAWSSSYESMPENQLSGFKSWFCQS